MVEWNRKQRNKVEGVLNEIHLYMGKLVLKYIANNNWVFVYPLMSFRFYFNYFLIKKGKIVFSNYFVDVKTFIYLYLSNMG